MSVFQGFYVGLCLKFFQFADVGCLIFANLLLLAVGGCKIKSGHSRSLIFQ
jgi:hypothetical protein